MFFNTEPVAYTGSVFGETNGPLIFSHVSCEGWETNLIDCDKLNYRDFTCSHYTVAGVMCSNGMNITISQVIFCFAIECKEGEIRLVNGKTENEGTIEICFDDLWGLISDSEWDNSDAEVVCRQLGYSTISMLMCMVVTRCTILIKGGSLASTGSHYGKPNKTMHAGNVRCHGDEANLQECSMTTYSLEKGKQLRQDTDVAGVSCVLPPLPISTSTSRMIKKTTVSTSSAEPKTTASLHVGDASSQPITSNDSGISPLALATLILVVVCIIIIAILTCAM